MTTLHLLIGRSSSVPIHQQIYIGTFSKVLFPAVRVGYLVVPTPLWQRFVDAREAFDLFSPTLFTSSRSPTSCTRVNSPAIFAACAASTRTAGMRC